MVRKQQEQASEEDIRKLYEPDFFYEHGDNPAYKKYIDVMKENMSGYESQDFKSSIIDNRNR